MLNQNAALRNIELRIAYSGSEFHGWQIQPRCATIQGELHRVLRILLPGEEIKSAGASRTDTGVHAHDQHVTFITHNTIPPEGLQKALNQLLPDGIRVLSVKERPEGFSARYHACAKHYAYFIWNRRTAMPFQEPYVWSHGLPLDVAAMNEALSHVTGTRCFRAFQSRRDRRPESVTTIFRAQATQMGPLFRIDVLGHRFLYHMVRNIVGSLVMVGRGEWTAAEFGERLDSGDRTVMGMTAPAHGLHLFKVYYSKSDDPAYAPDAERFGLALYHFAPGMEQPD